jgi:hypothetical protein
MIKMFVLLILVILKQDLANILLLHAEITTNAQLINAILNSDVLILLVIVMIMILALLILVIQKLDVLTLLSFVMITTHVPKTTAKQENAFSNQLMFLLQKTSVKSLLAVQRLEFTLTRRAVTTEIHAPLTLATAQLENANMMDYTAMITTNVLPISASTELANIFL